jgi:hypothetical protein
MLLLPECQAGEALEPSEKQHFFKNRGESDTNARLLFIAFKGENKTKLPP